MTHGRKRIDLEMVGKKSNRQRVWEAIRRNPERITSAELAVAAGVHVDAVRSYLQSLLAGGYLQVVAPQVQHRGQVLKLVRDVGVEAPAVTRSGAPSTAGLGNEAMWRTLRILRELNAQELADAASQQVQVSLATAKSYLKWLKRAGYVVMTSPGNRWQLARYHVVQDRIYGPLPPMIQGCSQVYDPNLGEVVYEHHPAANTGTASSLGA